MPYVVFADNEALSVRYREMVPSPFHGIFSAAMNADGGEPVSRVQHMPSAGSPSPAAQRSGGQVALDIFEYENYYIIKAPIAGVKLSDLDIEITDNVLTIRGIRRQTDSIRDDQYYLQECFWGEFSRSVTLPCKIDPRKVKATFNKDSILKIILPKEDERVKIIRIND